jgi:hypothetical protein
MLSKEIDCQRDDHHTSVFTFASYHNQVGCFKALYEHTVKMSGSSASIGDDDV